MGKICIKRRKQLNKDLINNYDLLIEPTFPFIKKYKIGNIKIITKEIDYIYIKIPYNHNNKNRLLNIYKKLLDIINVNEYKKVLINYINMSLINECCSYNKEIYKEISNKLNNYAFLVRALEYNFETDVLNFDVLIVGENDIPYSKVFINEKGSGNKFNVIFNEIADDYDNEIILLRKHFGLDVNPNNYLDYLKMIKNQALSFISEKLNIAIENISVDFPYSLFDFIYTQGNVKKYGILRVTTTRNKYFNLSIAQKMFLANMNDKCSVFLVSQALDNPLLTIYDCSDLDNLSISINSMKFREENL